MESNGGNFVFDKMTKNFIVTVKMTPKQYGLFAQEETVADMDK